MESLVDTAAKINLNIVVVTNIPRKFSVTLFRREDNNKTVYITS